MLVVAVGGRDSATATEVRPATIAIAVTSLVIILSSMSLNVSVETSTSSSSKSHPNMSQQGPRRSTGRRQIVEVRRIQRLAPQPQSLFAVTSQRSVAAFTAGCE